MVAAAQHCKSGRAIAGDDALRPTGAEASLLDAMPVACAVYDAGSGGLLHANPAFVREFAELGSIAARSEFTAHFQQFDAESPAHAAREVFAPKTARWYSLQWTRLDSPARPARALVSARDITRHMDAVRSHRQQQEKLMFTSRMMSVGEMAATLAHELNQPLATIINCINVGLRSLGRDAATQRIHDALMLARAQAQHAGDVIHHLREFVRSREPKRGLHDVASIVSAVTGLLQLEAQEHRVTIGVDIAPGLPKISVDRVMIEQVLLNLLKNAIEAMHKTEPRRRLAVVTARLDLDGDVEIRVADRGRGVPESEEYRVTAPFNSSKAQGMGVGLAICRSIIELHDGRLLFERAPGGGSVFGFTLPAVTAGGQRGRQ